jgi:hypothetical protein
VDTRKRFIDALTEQALCTTPQSRPSLAPHSLLLAEQDPEFADRLYEAIENAVDPVENTIHQRALAGDTIAAIS